MRPHIRNAHIGTLADEARRAELQADLHDFAGKYVRADADPTAAMIALMAAMQCHAGVIMGMLIVMGVTDRGRIEDAAMIAAHNFREGVELGTGYSRVALEQAGKPPC